MTDRVVVVGGGMLGLVVALRLAQAGRPVTVLEAADHLGGLADAWVLEGPVAVTWDRHYHVTLASDTALRRVLGELGLGHALRWRPTRTGYWSGRRLVPVSTPVDFLRLPGLSPVAKARLAATILAGMRTRRWERLEQVPVQAWLARWSGRRTFDRFWRPLLEAKLGARWVEANAAFIWATIQRLTAARRAGLRREEFGYVPGGYATVLERFSAHLRGLGVEVRTGAPVARVGAGPGGPHVELRSGEAIPGAAVVLTTTPARAAGLVDGLAATERQAWERIRYQGVVCASLLLRRALSPYYLTYLFDALPFTAVVEMTALVDPAELGGHHLVYLPRYAPPTDGIFTADDATITRRFLDGLRCVHPALRDEDVVTVRISRAPEVFPVPVLGYSRLAPTVETSVPGVFLASSAQIVNGTLNVNETVAAAERAVPVVLAAVGTHRAALGRLGGER